jgi:hypothetical protein
VCDTSIIRIELETLLGKALHKLILAQHCCHHRTIDGIEALDNQCLLATLICGHIRTVRSRQS